MANVMDKTKKEIKTFEETLQSLQDVKSLEKLRQDVRQAETSFSRISEQVRQAEERLKTIEHEAVLKSRETIQDAKEEASRLVKEAEKIRDDYLRKFQEVEAREKGVEWVKESEAKLKVREAGLKKAEGEVEKARVAVLTAESMWKEEIKTLDSHAQGLTERERKVAERERQLSMGIESEKKSKKGE